MRLVISCAAAVAVLLSGCGGSGGPPAPSISRVALSPGLVSSGQQEQIEATVTDSASTITKVSATVTFPDGQTTTVTLSLASGVFAATFTVPALAASAGDTVTAIVSATNAAGGSSSASTSGLRAPLQPPAPPGF